MQVMPLVKTERSYAATSERLGAIGSFDWCMRGSPGAISKDEAVRLRLRESAKTTRSWSIRE